MKIVPYRFLFLKAKSSMPTKGTLLGLNWFFFFYSVQNGIMAYRDAHFPADFFGCHAVIGESNVTNQLFKPVGFS
ncbi:hypothetical protein [Neobacillus notoginsengisoli]|uniref:hypothetical protein n=1 Tax=Neobacillus notoginsengisoli TaxID=1578198 RepID=UPI001F0025C4|nr:hypothetical protein [Neobacillus notoginsengisoli]